MVVRGTVVHFQNDAAFIELEPGVVGMAKKENISWRREVPHPMVALSAGEIVSCTILAVYADKRQIGLRVAVRPDRPAGVNPWDGVGDKYKPGQAVTGIVRRVMPYGVFVEVEPGVTGLWHRSAMGPHAGGIDLERTFPLDGAVTCTVMDVHPKEMKLGLQADVAPPASPPPSADALPPAAPPTPQLERPPEPVPPPPSPAPVAPTTPPALPAASWQATVRKYSPGTILSGRVDAFFKDLAFIEVAPGVRGQVQVAKGRLKRDDRITCVVLRVDHAAQLLELALTPTEPLSPEVLARYHVGDIVKGTVTNVASFGAFVALAPGLDGLLHVSEMAEPPPDDPRALLTPGEQIDVLIVGVNPEERRIALSRKRLPAPPQSVAIADLISELSKEAGALFYPPRASDLTPSKTAPKPPPAMAEPLAAEPLMAEAMPPEIPTAPAAAPTPPPPPQPPAPAPAPVASWAADPVERLTPQAVAAVLAQPTAGGAPQGERAECAVFAPAKVRPGTDAFIQAFTFPSGQESQAAALAREFDEDAVRRGLTTLTALLPHGAVLCFHLTLHGLDVKGPIRELTWLGKTAWVQFIASIPADRPPGNLLGTLLVSTAGLPIGRIDFKLTVAADGPASPSAAPVSVGSSAQRFRKAFVSYSSLDRPEVLRRVAMLRRPLTDLEVFQDILRLEPGEAYEPILFRWIDECDVFLLFWSSNARKSDWVQREIRRARQRQGAHGEPPPTILPVLLEGPPPPPPPRELAHLHFNDHLLYLAAAPAPPTVAPAPRPDGPRLIALRGVRVNATYPIREGRNTVGRGGDGSVEIDLTEQEAAGRTLCAPRHALIVCQAGRLTIEDLSENGAFVNRARLVPGQAHPLAANDVIQIGPVQLRVVL
jgi:predicted RNA-binding protein with RPS1 domain